MDPQNRPGWLTFTFEGAVIIALIIWQSWPLT